MLRVWWGWRQPGGACRGNVPQTCKQNFLPSVVASPGTRTNGIFACHTPWGGGPPPDAPPDPVCLFALFLLLLVLRHGVMQTCLYTCGVVVLLSPNVCIVLFSELFFFFFVRPHLFVGPVFYFYFFCFCFSSWLLLWFPWPFLCCLSRVSGRGVSQSAFVSVRSAKLNYSLINLYIYFCKKGSRKEEQTNEWKCA